MATFSECSCYFTHNIFLRRLTLHCTFRDDEQFRDEYREVSGGSFSGVVCELCDYIISSRF